MTGANEVTIGVISDLHWTSSPGAGYSWHNPFDFEGLPGRVDEALTIFADADVQAIAVTGDVTQFGDAASMEAALAATATIPRVPVLAVGGNHDLRPDGTDVTDAWAHVAGPLRLAGIPLVGVKPSRTADGYTASIEAGWDSCGPLVVVASHFPVISRAQLLEKLGMRYSGDLVNHGELLAEFVDCGTPVLALTGHIHTRETAVCRSVLQLSMGAMIEPPYDAAIVRIRIDHRSQVVVTRTCHSLRGPSGPRPSPVLVADSESWTLAADRWNAGLR